LEPVKLEQFADENGHADEKQIAAVGGEAHQDDDQPLVGQGEVVADGVAYVKRVPPSEGKVGVRERVRFDQAGLDEPKRPGHHQGEKVHEANHENLSSEFLQKTPETCNTQHELRFANFQPPMVV